MTGATGASAGTQETSTSSSSGRAATDVTLSGRRNEVDVGGVCRSTGPRGPRRASAHARRRAGDRRRLSCAGCWPSSCRTWPVCRFARSAAGRSTRCTASATTWPSGCRGPPSGPATWSASASGCPGWVSGSRCGCRNRWPRAGPPTSTRCPGRSTAGSTATTTTTAWWTTRRRRRRGPGAVRARAASRVGRRRPGDRSATSRRARRGRPGPRSSRRVTCSTPSAVLAAWDRALEAPVFTGDKVWIHTDLLRPNLLVHGGRLAAVIDFGAVGVGDPAADVIPAWTVFGAAGRARYREALDVDDGDLGAVPGLRPDPGGAHRAVLPGDQPGVHGVGPSGPSARCWPTWHRPHT